MAIGVFKLTKKQRSFLSVVFISLNVVQILSGFVMVILSVYIYFMVAPILYSERAEISYVFVVIGICGMNNIFSYTLGIRIAHKCTKQAHKKSTRTLLFAWTCVSFYVIFYLLVLAAMTRKIYKHIIRSMKHSLHIGMTSYLKNDVWKFTIDRLQFDLQCCGIHTYTEWHDLAWLGPHQVNSNNEMVKQLRTGDSWNLPVTPWSCCKISATMQCLHDPLQQVRSISTWNDERSQVLQSLNTKGCIEKLKLPIQEALLFFILLVALNFVTQILIVPLSRILYTSCRNAVLLRDPNGVAPGWIFGRGDCGYNHGKTLGEIMMLMKKPDKKSTTRTPSVNERKSHTESQRLLAEASPRDTSD